MSLVELSPIHVIGFAAGLLLVYRSVRLVRTRREGLAAFLLWAGFGAGLLVLVAGSALTTVDMLDTVAAIVGLLGFNIGRDAVLLTGNFLLLFLLFYAYTTMAENRRQLYDLTQEVALLRYELDRERNESEERGREE